MILSFSVPFLQSRSKNTQTGKLCFARKYDYAAKSFVPDLDLDTNKNSITRVTENQESRSQGGMLCFFKKKKHMTFGLGFLKL